MNKQHLILPFVLISTLLVSCGGGKTLSSAEAVKRANTITAFHENSAFVYPSDSVTFTLAITDLPMGYGVNTSEIRSKKGTYFYSKASTSQASSSEANKNVTNYFYSQDGKYYWAKDNETSKNYSELSASDFATELKTRQDALASRMKMFSEAAYNLLKNIAAELSSSSAASNTAKVTTNYTFASSGENNLAFTVDATEKDSTADLKTSTTYVFQNNYPVSTSGYSKGTEASSDSLVTVDDSAGTTYDWSNCTPLYPNRSEYSKL